MRILLIFLLISLFSINKTISQTPLEMGDPKINVIPSTPEVATLNKFIDMPVSLSTGIPQINIPIYALELNGLSIPISLNYHASGIKMDELAPNTGMGWSLSAGWNISQSINGLNDFWNTFGWLNTSAKTPQTGLLRTNFYGDSARLLMDMPEYIFNKTVTDGFVDSEPDIFYFSLPGKNGKFFFDQNKQAHFMPFQKMKISYQSDGNRANFYQITDEAGNNYIFDKFETTGSQIISTCALPSSTESPSALLTKIYTAGGRDTVFFLYDTISYTYEGQISETRGIRISGTNANNRCPSASLCQTKSTLYAHSQRISEIRSTRGHRIKFNYTGPPRLDLPGTYPLTEIIVYNSNTQIQKHKLNFDYFPSGSSTNNVTLSYRLKLTSVVKNDTEQYVLDYDNTALPPRLSLAQDHWGYYNGAISNNTLLPKDIDKGFSEGADRETNPGYAKAGVLKKITYPTGGFVSFDFESNAYAYRGNKSIAVADGVQSMPSSEQNETTSFTVPLSARDFTVSWKINNPTGKHITLTGPDNFNRIFTESNTGNLSITNLPAGNYTLTFNYTTDPFELVDDYIRINWVFNRPDTVIEDRYTGGLRIKTIQFDPKSGESGFTKNYSYLGEDGSNLSSGQLIYTPRYDYISHQLSGPQDGTTWPICNYATQVSYSVAPLGIIQGGNITYDRVSEYVTDKTKSGLTIYEFINEGAPTEERNELDLTYIKFPFAPKVPNDWLYGLLKKIKVYKYNAAASKFDLVSVNEKSYKRTIGEGPNESFVRGAKIAVDLPMPCDDAGCGPILFAIDYYFLNSSWLYLNKEVDSTYDNNGKLLVQTTWHRYDNPIHAQLTNTELLQSDGRAKGAFTIYPEDYLSGTAFIDSMVAKNQIALPIEKIMYVKNGGNLNITSGRLTQYTTEGKGLPEKIFYLNLTGGVNSSLFKFSSKGTGILPNTGSAAAFNKDNRYLPRIHFNQYSSRGNILEQQKANDVKEVYLWGYNGQYPVVKVLGSDYTTVISKVSNLQSQIDAATGADTNDVNLRTLLNSLRSAFSTDKMVQVSTYTYKPLVGMTSETDPTGHTIYYEYDSFNRLKLQKDEQGNILKKYCYNYAGQPIDCN